MTAMGNAEGGRLHKIKEVAQQLRVSHDVVKRLVNPGKLPAHHVTPKILRISQADVDAFLESTKRNDFNAP